MRRRGRKVQGRKRRKKGKAACNEHSGLLFFSRCLSGSACLGFGFSGLQLEDIAGLTCCPPHLLRRGQNHSRHKLQREEDTDATVTAGKSASGPSALFFSFFLSKAAFLTYALILTAVQKKSWGNSFSHTYLSLQMASEGRGPCCDCATLGRDIKRQRRRPSGGVIVTPNMERSRLRQKKRARTWAGAARKSHRRRHETQLGPRLQTRYCVYTHTATAGPFTRT